MSELLILNADSPEKEDFVKLKQVVAIPSWTQKAFFFFLTQ